MVAWIASSRSTFRSLNHRSAFLTRLSWFSSLLLIKYQNSISYHVTTLPFVVSSLLILPFNSVKSESRQASLDKPHVNRIYIYIIYIHWSPVKADSHIAYSAHAVSMPFPCHAELLIHTCHAAPLPCSDSAVSFVKVRKVAGNIRTASPTV